ncbi:hypothetical protein WJX73_001083 [Symbiochloris irregularis]|uniref:Uncharacterized protein n=1 Tax=Symbiochloris irregularis TaxID=706552 RepID=A0AAW1PFI3_9CHLO
MVGIRQLRELQSLIPFSWDERLEDHPAGAAALKDFQTAFQWQERPKRRSTLSQPASGRPAKRPRAKARSVPQNSEQPSHHGHEEEVGGLPNILQECHCSPRASLEEEAEQMEHEFSPVSSGQTSPERSLQARSDTGPIEDKGMGASSQETDQEENTPFNLQARPSAATGQHGTPIARIAQDSGDCAMSLSAASNRSSQSLVQLPRMQLRSSSRLREATKGKVSVATPSVAGAETAVATRKLAEGGRQRHCQIAQEPSPGADANALLQEYSSQIPRASNQAAEVSATGVSLNVGIGESGAYASTTCGLSDTLRRGLHLL